MNCYNLTVKSNTYEGPSVSVLLLADQADKEEQAFIAKLKFDDAEKYCEARGWKLIKDNQPAPEVTAAPETKQAVHVSPAPKKSRPKIIIAGVLLVAVIVAGVFVGQSAKARRYASNFSSALSTMRDGAIKAEEVCTLTQNVWYDSIYEKSDAQTDAYTQYSENGSTRWYDDFNDALSNLYADGDLQDKISDITTCQQSVAELMSKLRNPPKRYAEGYAVMRELYGQFSTFATLAIGPTGSYNSYTDAFNEVTSNFINYYNEAITYISY